jgi:hypothetical protein
LGLPVLIAAVAIAVSAWFSDNGAIVTDPNAEEPQLPVRTVTNGGYGTGWQGSTNLATIDVERERARIHSGDNKSFAAFEVESGPVRTFAFYWIGSSKQNKSTDEMFSAALNSIRSFEQRRGAVLSADEQPVLIGWNILVQESAAPKRTYARWTHLKRAVDWERVAVAGAVAVLALLIYVIARALGWIIAGFVSKPEA